MNDPNYMYLLGEIRKINLRLDASVRVQVRPGSDFILANSTNYTPGGTTPLEPLRISGDDGYTVRLEENNDSNASTHRAALLFYRYGGTDAAPTPMPAGSRLGVIAWVATRGTVGGAPTTGTSALIDCYGEGADTLAQTGSSLRFSTTAAGSTVPYERLRIADSGAVGIGNTAPQALLDVVGVIRSTGYGTYPTTGAGLELYYSGSYGRVLAINRDTAVYIPLYLTGSEVRAQISGLTQVTVTTGLMTLADNVHIAVGSTNGTQSGTAITQKIGFYGTTPIVQRTNAAQAAAPAGGTGTAAGGWDTAAHRDSAIALLNEIRTVLVNLGLMKGS